MGDKPVFADIGSERGGYDREGLRAAPYVIVLALACSALGAEGIVLRASVTPEEVWVGQRASLNIDVLGRDGWAQIKTIRDLEVPGAYVMGTQSQGIRLQETIGGVSYTGQRYQVSIYPQRGGTIEVPALPVEVTIKAWGLNAAETEQVAEIPGTTFTCQVPPGAERIRGLISTTQFKATQTWEPQTDTVNVGDAITRTIMLKAADVSGMAFTPIEFPALDGLGVYPGEAVVEDASDRGSLTGTRTETVTYIFEHPGQIEITAVVLSWWDVTSQELKRVELDGLVVQVVGRLAAEADVGAETGAGPGQGSSLLLWSILTAAAVTVAVGIRFRRQMLAGWMAWQRTRRESEAAHFRGVIRSIRSGDPKAVLRATMRWLDRINTDPGPAQLDLFLRQYGDAGVREAAMRLMTDLSSGREDGDLSTLRRGLADARSRWRHRHRQREKVTRALPVLNAPLGSFDNGRERA